MASINITISETCAGATFWRTTYEMSIKTEAENS